MRLTEPQQSAHELPVLLCWQRRPHVDEKRCHALTTKKVVLTTKRLFD